VCWQIIDHMHTKRIGLFTLLLLLSHIIYAQQQFKVVVKTTGDWREIYSLVDKKGKLIRQLDTAKYYVAFNTDQYVHFAVFGIKGVKGWAAIDASEKMLFNVYNTSFGEPTPDYLFENKIRITDSTGLIGFADNKGRIIIRPQFEIASSFHNGKAIIGQQCKKIPWGQHEDESGCYHYSITCERHGYINEKGIVLKLGNYSLDQIKEEIGWISPDE
jgi:hypothetical protein